MMESKRRPTIGSLRAVLAAVTLFAATSRVPAQDSATVDLELVLAVDSSGSIDEDEAHLQRGGWASAITHPHVVGAIRSGRHGAVAVMFLEWAAPGCETVSVPWTRLTDAASAQAFANAIMAALRVHCPGGNAIGDAVAFAAQEIHGNAFRGERRVIDVSGDGPNTRGRPIEPIRDAVVASGITINGLALLRRRAFFAPLDEYFRLSLVGGPGAFVIAADKETEFRQAVLAKLVREIAGIETDGRAASLSPVPAPPGPAARPEAVRPGGPPP
jgi:hypothetical protein